MANTFLFRTSLMTFCVSVSLSSLIPPSFVFSEMACSEMSYAPPDWASHPSFCTYVYHCIEPIGWSLPVSLSDWWRKKCFLFLGDFSTYHISGQGNKISRAALCPWPASWPVYYHCYCDSEGLHVKLLKELCVWSLFFSLQMTLVLVRMHLFRIRNCQEQVKSKSDSWLLKFSFALTLCKSKVSFQKKYDYRRSSFYISLCPGY